jgi:hypothetical protein
MARPDCVVPDRREGRIGGAKVLGSSEGLANARVIRRGGEWHRWRVSGKQGSCAHDYCAERLPRFGVSFSGGGFAQDGAAAALDVLGALGKLCVRQWGGAHHWRRSDCRLRPVAIAAPCSFCDVKRGRLGRSATRHG